MKKKPKNQIPMNSPEYHDQFRKKLENFLNGTNSQPLKNTKINNMAVATWLKQKARHKQGWAFVPMNRLFKLRKINVRNKFFSRVALLTGYLKYRKLRCLQPLLEWYPPTSEDFAAEQLNTQEIANLKLAPTFMQQNEIQNTGQPHQKRSEINDKNNGESNG